MYGNGQWYPILRLHVSLRLRMASNYWQSSCCNRWTLGLQASADFQPLDKSYFKPVEIKWLRLYFVELLDKIGKQMGFRQRLISTAIILFKRFYTKESFVNFDPFLVVPTILLIAAKIEEWPCKVDKLLSTFTKHSPMNNSSHYSVDDIIQCEFYSLEILEFDLIVYHPYRPLLDMLGALNLMPHEGDSDSRKYMDFSWAVVNDSLRTDLCLFYAPHVIAAASIYIMLNFLNRRDEQILLLKTLSKQTLQLIEVATKILDLYDFYQNRTFDTRKLIDKLYKTIRSASIN